MSLGIQGFQIKCISLTILINPVVGDDLDVTTENSAPRSYLRLEGYTSDATSDKQTWHFSRVRYTQTFHELEFGI